MDLVDSKTSPKRMEVTTPQFAFSPIDVVLKKSNDFVNHLNPLFMKGHVNGSLVSHMLVDNRAPMKLLVYSLYEKLGGIDEELIKTNMDISRVGVKDPIPATGVGSMEVTIGSKTLATTFFVDDI